MGSVDEAKKLLLLLTEDDPAHALADLTHWTATMNTTDSFTPGRRGRVLLAMHQAAQPLWRALGQEYLAPDGRPTEGVDGDPAILRAMSDSASEFSNGFALTLDAEGKPSTWVRGNLALLSICSLRWLGRRLSLAYMLQSPLTVALWERLHRRYTLAVAGEASRTALPAYEGSRYKTTAQIEYARPLLLELAHPDAIRPREVELVYRIAARVANAVRLDEASADDANFAVVPKGGARPTLKRLLRAAAAAPLFIATANCLPRLRAALEQDMGHDPDEENTLYGRGYTLRERDAILNRVIAHWGMDPPRRRVQRIPMSATARVTVGFENVLKLLPAIGSAPVEDAGTARRRLQLRIDETSKRIKRTQLRTAQIGTARIVDASAGGVGLAITRTQAYWATHGALLAVLIEPGQDWFLGALKRIFSIDDELRLGVQVLAAKPCAVTLRIDSHAHVWEEATRRDADYDERYRRGILLEPQALPLTGGAMLLPPGLAKKGALFYVQLDKGEQRIEVTRVLEDNPSYQRVIYA